MNLEMTYNLTDADIKKIISEWFKVNKNVDVKSVWLSYYQADSRDPREVSSHSATVRVSNG